MIIHVVRAGENINSIADRYDVSAQSIIDNNALTNPENLVPGQTLVILIPKIIYTVQEGDTVSGIAQSYGITDAVLLQNNPIISSAGNIFPGQTLVIEYEGEKRGSIATNGYVYPNVDRNVLIKTLPYLTYLTVFTYGFREDGSLVTVDDAAVLELAKQYGVGPIMTFSTIGEDGMFSNELASFLLNNPAAQNTVISNIIQIMNEKGYIGVDVDFEYIPPEDAEKYVSFIIRLREALEPYGYQVIVALAPKTSADQPGLLYEAHNYAALGRAADYVLLMTYEWGYTYGPPMAVAPINKVQAVLDYAITEIPPYKINMGMPNYGYDWQLPFEQGISAARSLSNVGAVELAAQTGAEIQYDEISQAPFFFYYDEQGNQHEVWFEDARSVEAKVNLAFDYGFNGITFWNLMKFFPQSWLVISSLYNIDKI